MFLRFILFVIAVVVWKLIVNCRFLNELRKVLGKVSQKSDVVSCRWEVVPRVHCVTHSSVFKELCFKYFELASGPSLELILQRFVNRKQVFWVFFICYTTFFEQGYVLSLMNEEVVWNIKWTTHNTKKFHRFSHWQRWTLYWKLFFTRNSFCRNLLAQIQKFRRENRLTITHLLTLIFLNQWQSCQVIKLWLTFRLKNPLIKLLLTLTELQLKKCWS